MYGGRQRRKRQQRAPLAAAQVDADADIASLFACPCCSTAPSLIRMDSQRTL